VPDGSTDDASERFNGGRVYLDESHGQMRTATEATSIHDRDRKPEAEDRRVDLPSSLSRSSSASSASSVALAQSDVSMSISIEEPHHRHADGGLTRNFKHQQSEQRSQQAKC